MAQEESVYRTNSIRSLSEKEYMVVNTILSSRDAKWLCAKLAAATRYTSEEWSDTLICAVSDYVGHGGCV